MTPLPLPPLDGDDVSDRPAGPGTLDSRLGELQAATDALDHTPTFEQAEVACMAARWVWYHLWSDWDDPAREPQAALKRYAGLMKRVIAALTRVRPDSGDTADKLAHYLTSCTARWTFARSLVEGGRPAAMAAMDAFRSPPDAR